MSTWLPTFLQPLLLIPHYKNRIAASVQSFITGSHDQLFGPLEQVVAAVVIIALALQTLPNLESQTSSPNAGTGRVDTDSNSSSIQHGPCLSQSPMKTLQHQLKDALDQYTPSPPTFALIALLINLAILLIPADLRRRLNTSWKLFWPHWQQRSHPPPTTEESSSHGREAPSVPKDSSDRRAQPKRTGPKAEAASGDKLQDWLPTDKEREKMKNLTDEQKAKLRAEQKERAKQAAEASKEMPGDKANDKSGSRGRTIEAGVQPPLASEKSGDEKLSQSERARKVKEGKDSSVTSEKGKGKGQMSDERPSDPDSPSTPKVLDEETTGTETEGSGPDTDDPLMAGDYRPLKSVLRKSKKKPRQKKNIHHNYFMTMRGWKPSLIPFPHGFHPKPHHPRNTLWWNNIPENPDHITAPPPVPKAPEKDEDGDGEDAKKGSEKGKGKDGEQKEKGNEKKSKDSDRKEDTKKGEKPEAESSPASTSKTDANRKDSSRPGDADKVRLEERAKAKSEAEAEAKLKAKQKAEAEAKAKLGAAGSARPAQIPVDPQIQKATYVAQGLLCVLLYLVNEQLGFLLLAFFAYQYISRQQAATEEIPPLVAPEAPRDSSRSSSKEAHADSSNERRGKKSDADKPVDPSILKHAKSSTSFKKSEVPDGRANGNVTGPEQELPTRFQDLTPEQQERYKLLLEQKRRRTKETMKPTGEGLEQGNDDKLAAVKGKEKAAAGPRHRDAKDRAATQPREAKRYEDLTDEQKAEYSRARAKRKTQEKGTTKLGQGSGLSTDEKAALSRPPSPTA